MCLLERLWARLSKNCGCRAYFCNVFHFFPHAVATFAAATLALTIVFLLFPKRRSVSCQRLSKFPACRCYFWLCMLCSFRNVLIFVNENSNDNKNVTIKHIMLCFCFVLFSSVCVFVIISAPPVPSRKDLRNGPRGRGQKISIFNE